jgi:hypothetical protein
MESDYENKKEEDRFVVVKRGFRERNLRDSIRERTNIWHRGNAGGVEKSSETEGVI